MNNLYILNIFDRYTDLKKSNKLQFTKNDISKIFEYYSCIKLSNEYKKTFYEYDDIDPNFKELNKMSKTDTGIDCSDLIDTIVQCKLRTKTLSWKECGTFFGSQNIFDQVLKTPIIRWNNLIITRNSECKLSKNLSEKSELFTDITYSTNEIINFCENLMTNPPICPIVNTDFKLRDYQLEAINVIKDNKKNVIINLPTGTGKNSVIILSMNKNLKYLVLVPRIILMDQLKLEIIKHLPVLKNKIQLIGDSNNTFDDNKLITICVFNSVHLIQKYFDCFDKIYIDEAHHINKPAIYIDDNYDDNENEEVINLNESDDYDDDDDNLSINQDIVDDSEDELVNVKNYTEIIKNLIKYNNNVYLSATIDKLIISHIIVRIFEL